MSQWTLQIVDKSHDFGRLLSKIDNTAIIKILKDSLVNILSFPSNTINKLDKKLIFLISAIDKAINASAPKKRLCSRLIPGFDQIPKINT